jgi:HD-GYP domain-containing protein (c-di-GMP phosphodiesterase class II)
LELAEEEIHNIALGGMLHDVGKLELNDQLFRNHCKSLSEEMWEEVYSHPLIGAALLDQVHCQNTIFEAVLFHHERMDGSGYPFGFKGEQIPISARIVGVADCFDAITTDRPYQRKKDCTHAFRILNGMAGACLDAELVPHFIEEIIESGIVASDDTAPAEA